MSTNATRCAAACLAAFSLVSSATATRAATISVNAFTDDYDLGPNGNCTLREAVIAANQDSPVDGCPAGAGADIIELGAGTYALTVAGAEENGASTGDLDVYADLVVRGAGAGATTIDGALSDRVFDIGAPHARIEALTIRNGFVSASGSYGAGIRHAAGNLVLDHVVVSDSGYRVGGVTSLTLRGGGLYVAPGATTRLESSMLSSNQAKFGGGVYVEVTGHLELMASAIFDNFAQLRTGGIEVWGSLDASSSTIASNDSFSFTLPSPIVFLHPAGLVLATGGRATLDFVTIADGLGSPDVYLDPGSGPLTLHGTIVQATCGGSTSSIASDGYNLASTPDCHLTQPTDRAGIDAQLASVAMNGTVARVPGPSSPAIDAGGLVGCPVEDQWHTTRPQGSACDIGAVEVVVPSCTDADGDGAFAEGGSCGALDCDDAAAAVHPGATEVCNAIDDDCDLAIDETFPSLGQPCTAGVGACERTGVFACSSDGLSTTCNATPGEPGVEGPNGAPSCANGVDDDCDGTSDSSDASCAPSCTDLDGDSYAREGGPCGTVDCDDANPQVNPGHAEAPGNGIDDDCNPATPDCKDLDADGYGNPASASCPHAQLDCNDGDAASNPGKTEVPGNGKDDDCNPATPGGCSAP